MKFESDAEQRPHIPLTAVTTLGNTVPAGAAWGTRLPAWRTARRLPLTIPGETYYACLLGISPDAPVEKLV